MTLVLVGNAVRLSFLTFCIPSTGLLMESSAFSSSAPLMLTAELDDEDATILYTASDLRRDDFVHGFGFEMHDEVRSRACLVLH